MKKLVNTNQTIYVFILFTLVFGLLNSKTPVKKTDGFLRGTFIVRCPNGHDDQVDGITRNHDCEKCGQKAVDGGTARLVCPDGHATRVEGITEGHLCTQPIDDQGHICGKQCRR